MQDAQKIMRRERSPEQYLPYIRHADENTVITRNRGAFQVIHLEGVSIRTASTQDINSFHNKLSHVLRNISDKRITIYTHIIRNADNGYLAGEFISDFGQSLDQAYKKSLERSKLFRNDIYLTVYIQPDDLGLFTLAKRFKKPRTSEIEADADMLEDLRECVSRIMSSLDRFGPTQLGINKHENGYLCSEPSSFLHRVLTGKEKSVPIVNGTVGSAIYTDRIIFGSEALEIRHIGSSTYGTILGAKEWADKTRPIMNDDLLLAPFPYIMTHSFRFAAKQSSADAMRFKENKMRNAGDDAVTQADDLRDGRDELQSGKFIMGEHNMSLLVLSDTAEKLRSYSSKAETLLSNSGAVVVREDAGMESAYWAKFPANMKERLRPALITSRNFAAMSPLHNYPSGKATGNEWGDAICKFKTDAFGPFYFSFHIGDLGHLVGAGPSGSGKTVIFNFLLSQLEKANVKRILFDKDKGAEIYVRASGGSYLDFKTGIQTGCAPFATVDLTPEGKLFLTSLTTSMLASNQHPFTASDTKRIEAAIHGLKDIPKNQRSVSVLRELMGYGSGEASDIGDRLERWTQTGPLGWVFDTEVDSINFDANLVGFDITEFLDIAEIRNPIMMYLMHRVDELVTGQRIAIFIAELWKSLSDPYFVSFIQNKLKVIRKQNGIIVGETQSVSDIIKSQISKTIIEQCANQLFFGNEKADRTEYIDGLGLTEREYEIVRNELSIGQFLIKQKRNSVVCQLDLTGQDDLLAVLSGRTAETTLMNELRAEYPDPRDWLPMFHEKRKEIS